MREFEKAAHTHETGAFMFFKCSCLKKKAFPVHIMYLTYRDRHLKIGPEKEWYG